MPVCWDHAAALQRVDGDAELLAELIEIFFEDYPRHRDCLFSSLTQNDYGTLCKVAHTLKGSLGYLGAVEGAQLAALIERAGHKGDAVELRPLVAAFAAYLELLREAMLSSAGEPEIATHRH